MESVSQRVAEVEDRDLVCVLERDEGEPAVSGDGYLDRGRRLRVGRLRGSEHTDHGPWVPMLGARSADNGCATALGNEQ